eukprot:5513740-Amphidinium_carterae.1
MGAAMATIQLMNEEEKRPATDLSQPNIPPDHPEHAANQAIAGGPATIQATASSQATAERPAAATTGQTHQHTLIYDDT